MKLQTLKPRFTAIHEQLLDPSELPLAPEGAWTRVQRRFSGWRGGFVACATLVAVVALINIGFTIWAVAKYGVSDGVGTIHSGL